MGLRSSSVFWPLCDLARRPLFGRYWVKAGEAQTGQNRRSRPKAGNASQKVCLLNFELKALQARSLDDRFERLSNSEIVAER